MPRLATSANPGSVRLNQPVYFKNAYSVFDLIRCHNWQFPMTDAPTTTTEREVKQLRKHLRQSKAAIPGVLVFGVLSLAVLLVVDLFLTVPGWIYALVLWVVPFGLVGDGVNIIFIKRKLARLQEEADSSNT